MHNRYSKTKIPTTFSFLLGISILPHSSAILYYCLWVLPGCFVQFWLCLCRIGHFLGRVTSWINSHKGVTVEKTCCNQEHALSNSHMFINKPYTYPEFTPMPVKCLRTFKYELIVLLTSTPNLSGFIVCHNSFSVNKMPAMWHFWRKLKSWYKINE